MQEVFESIEQAETHSISYSAFMKLALYHPTKGYYMKDQTKIGKTGDFYTSSSVSPIFAEMMASRFIKLINEQVIEPVIIEMGGGNGRFARQVLKTWQSESNDTYKEGHYYIVESSPYHQSLIQQEVKEFQNVTIVYSLEEIQKIYEKYNGIIFSNEFFDAFPVDVIRMVDNEVVEVRISANEQNKLVETLVPLNKSLTNFIDEYQITVSEGQTYEIPKEMCSFIRELGEWIEKGIVITIDYGYLDEEWSLPFHKDGSLRGYYQHQLIENPLVHVGEMDLTTHIHFDKLIRAGQEIGLDFYKMYRQDEFLLKAGILEELKEHDDRNPFSEASKRNRAIRSLLVQGGISSSFHVVIQTKNVQKEVVEEII
ncbi:class I SAM-dependent methyltransferase [Bacillus sp. AK128]